MGLGRHNGRVKEVQADEARWGRGAVREGVTRKVLREVRTR